MAASLLMIKLMIGWMIKTTSYLIASTRSCSAVAKPQRLDIIVDGVIDTAPLTQQGAPGCVRIVVSASGGGAYQ